MNIYKITFIETTNGTRDSVADYDSGKRVSYKSVNDGETYVQAETAAAACSKVGGYGRGVRECSYVGKLWDNEDPTDTELELRMDLERAIEFIPQKDRTLQCVYFFERLGTKYGITSPLKDPELDEEMDKSSEELDNMF